MAASFARRRSTLLSAVGLVAGLALATGGCTLPGATDVADVSLGGVPEVPAPTDTARLRAYAQEMAPRYAADPDNRAVAIRYAAALRGLSQHAQAVAVMQRLAAKDPKDMVVLGAYGKALADAGRLQEAADVLAHSHTPERPDWHILSAQGSVADQMGDHAQAQAYYATALKIVPGQPQVLSNLGLSYALQHQMPLAEQTLREAAAQPAADRRVRQNLTLVLALEGKYGDAETVSRNDLSPLDAADNVQSIKQMIAQSDTWRGMGRPVASKPRKVAAVQRVQRVPDDMPTRTAAADDLR